MVNLKQREKMNSILDYLVKYKLILTNEMKEDLTILLTNVMQRAFERGERSQRDFPRTEGS